LVGISFSQLWFTVKDSGRNKQMGPKGFTSKSRGNKGAYTKSALCLPCAKVIAPPSSSPTSLVPAFNSACCSGVYGVALRINFIYGVVRCVKLIYGVVLHVTLIYGVVRCVRLIYGVVLRVKLIYYSSLGLAATFNYLQSVSS